MINANYEGPIKLTAPAGGVVGGQGYIIGALFVVAIVSVAEGLKFDGLQSGCVTLDKADGVALAEGGKVYWNNTTKKVTSVAAENYLIGACETAAADTATEARVYLIPRLVDQEAAA